MAIPRRTAGAPPEILAVAALFVLVAAVIGVPTLQALPDILSILGEGEFGRAIGSLLLSFALVLIVLCLVCVACARLLYFGDPVGRILSIGIAASLIVGILLGTDDLEGWDFIAVIASAAVIAIVGLVPRAADHFWAPAASAEPTTVAAARVIVVIVAAVHGVLGIGLLPIITLDLNIFVSGLATIAVSVLAILFSGQVASGSLQARTALSVVMGSYGLLALWSGGGVYSVRDDPAVFVPVSLAVVVIGLLWGPKASQEFFARSPQVSRSLMPDLALFGESAMAGVSVLVGSGSSPGTRPGSGPAAFRPVDPAAPPPSYPPPPRPPVAPGPGMADTTGRDSRPAAKPIQLMAEPIRGSSPERSQALGIDFDGQSWMPVVPDRAGQGLVAAFLVPGALDLRGTTTLVLDGQRLIGVCFKGRSARGEVGPHEGRVVVWEVPLDALGSIEVEELRPGQMCALLRAGADGSDVLRLARIRRPSATGGETEIGVETFVRRLKEIARR